MAGKPRTRAKVSGNGANVVATIPLERLRALLPSLPEGDDRRVLEEALGEADVVRAERLREDRLETPLSIESLIPMGWMLAGTHSGIAYGAIRRGDFRRETDGAWTFGPPGAFDRDDAGTTVMRNAVQAGVMSEAHSVYLLLEPTPSQAAAVAGALRLQAEWLRDMPAKRRKPKALADERGMRHSDWPAYLSEKDLEGLPEGARISRDRGAYDHPSAAWRVTDIVHKRDDHVCVCTFRCDAVLRPVKVYTLGNLNIGTATRTVEYRWAVGRRDYDPNFDTHRPAALTGPYDCVLGSVWSVDHNGRIGRDEAVALPHISTGRNSGSVDRRDNVVFPITSREDAEVAIGNFAAALGMVEGPMRPMPDTVPAPDMGAALDFAEAA
jgi:hypothetical protein